MEMVIVPLCTAFGALCHGNYFFPTNIGLYRVESLILLCWPVEQSSFYHLGIPADANLLEVKFAWRNLDAVVRCKGHLIVELLFFQWASFFSFFTFFENCTQGGHPAWKIIGHLITKARSMSMFSDQATLLAFWPAVAGWLDESQVVIL